MVAAIDMISRFLAWWFGELKASVPGRVRALFGRQSAALVMVPADDGVAFALHQGGRSRELGHIQFGPGPDQRRALAQLMHGASVQDADVIVNLPAERVPRRSVTLPVAAQENLREVLAFEMDRHTPFKASEVAFDYRVTGTDADNKRLMVDLAVVPRDLLEHANSVANSFGLTLDRIGIAGEDSPGRQQFNFLSRDQSAGSPAARQRLLAALALLVALTALIAAYLPLYVKERTLAARQAQLAETRIAAFDADALKTRLASKLEHGRFLIGRRLSTPAATRLLAEVSERLPDDTWLLEIQWHGKELLLSGFSPAAAALIKTLEESLLLSEVRFHSPVMTDPRVKRERFNISADVAATADQ
jgi:general secretion pathway protein L